jgi:DnaK suppressor protein
MDPATLETYRVRLLAQQQHIVKRIFNLEDDLQAVGDAEREIERMDRVQAEASGEVLEKLDQQSRLEMEAIQAALGRIEAGTYGDCETCGTDINPARLEALPMTRRCIRCQELAEKTAKE